MTYNYARANNVKNKTVLLRVDMNEELDAEGKIVDDFRIRAIIPTIAWLRSQGAKVIVASHAGRPGGKKDIKLSLEPMSKRLADLLKIKFVKTDRAMPDYPLNHLVFFSGDISQGASLETIKAATKKDIVVLENLRFYKGEEENDVSFAKQLARLADVFVNDAFAVSHRKAASVVAVTKYLPSYVGPLLEKEIKNLDYVINKAKQPFVLIMGGIKISDKAKTLERLGRKADAILVGGGIANLFFASEGLEIGKSRVELESKKLAWKIATNFKRKLILPKDVVVSDAKMNPSATKVKSSYDIKPSEVIYDIGPKAILEYSEIIKGAKTICWNGPLGFFEKKPFHTGTFSLSRVIGGVGKNKAFVVVGGGETVAALRLAKQEEYVDHVSTGGGAMLEYLAGDILPGLKVLQK
jgi:phosphoglycerate kinase